MRIIKRWRSSSFSAIIVTIFTLLGISGVVYASGGAMFNPGSLSIYVGAPLGGITSHSEIQKCGDCHSTPWGTETMSDRCLQCHADITAQLNDKASLHSLISFGQSSLNCRDCHTEHHGPTASVTRIPPGWNPHDQLGFSLKAHRLRMDGAPFECKDCHEKGYNAPFDQLTCANCHLNINQVFATEHILTFWTDCQSCHDGIDSHGKSFDHNQVSFNLIGIHKITVCSKCHISAHSLVDLQSAPQDCFACHQKDDAHTGQFGDKCGICHTAEDWQKSAQFDHNLANFKLTGLHVNVACASCHINNVYKGIPADCFSCHQKDDKHNGAFGIECGTCHIPDGWDRAVDHTKFAFPLEGKHANIACDSCHQNAVFKGTPSDCVSCHAKDDIHAGQFGNQCGDCHTPNNWTSASFDHNTAAFTLKAHQIKTDGSAFACTDCHANGYARPFDQIACANCHLQINQSFATEHILTFWTDCMACHDGLDSHGSSFDHNLVPFKLNGKHAQAVCANCHINDRTIADMQATSQDCISCHTKDDFHAGALGTNCAACHAPDGWKPAKIDHSQFAFHLDGKHITAACSSCHTNSDFKNTPSDCASCHTKDDAHAGKLGAQCGTCHTSASWTSAAFDHNTVAFSLDAHKTKTDGSAFACKDCHINGYAALFDQTSCGNCHLQINQAFSVDHFLTFGIDCKACHDGLDSHGSSFDHNLVSFKLNGKHGQLVCVKCHISARNLANLKAVPQDCISCHAKDDFHAGALGTNCAACHAPDGWKPAKIDHSQFAFHLDGKHITAACSNCHTDSDFKSTPSDCVSCHTKDDKHNGQFGTNCATCHSTQGWKLAKVDHTAFALDGKHAAVACESCHQGGVFKGTPSDCASCHTRIDPHGGKLGAQCASCHTVNGWSPSTFDHKRSDFALAGKHSAVACSQCHADKLFKGTPSDCASCHTRIDPHGGKLGAQCASCHTVNGWTPSTFDHKRSDFALAGKHSAVACGQCHADKLFKGTPSDCASCHTKNDVHAGKLGAQCASCHTVNGWTPSTFDHKRSDFPLTGNHIKIACNKCHTDLKFKGTPTECYSCHSNNDRHGGKYGTNCSSCHSTSAWKPATFNHNLSGFKLTGAHTDTDCAKCHVNNVFAGTPKDCYSCHSKNDNHNGAYGTDCSSCHSTSAWKPAAFDHKLSSFKLTGAHTDTACAKCHVNNKFAGTPKDCYSCHSKNDNHNGAYGKDCSSCHSTSAWKPATFDHNLSSFKLTGAHINTTCDKCHVNNKFAGTPKDCYSCHAKNDNHNGKYGTDCSACHSTKSWKSASFKHTFPLNHGDGGSVACTTCHPNNTSSYTCYGCHEHTASKISSKHIEEGITNYKDCVQCHVTGNKDGEGGHD